MKHFPAVGVTLGDPGQLLGELVYEGVSDVFRSLILLDSVGTKSTAGALWVNDFFMCI